MNRGGAGLRPRLQAALASAAQWLHRARPAVLKLLAFALLFGLTQAQAHKASDSYLVLKVSGQAVTGQWDIALRDIDFALGLDPDGSGSITWGELRARQADLAAWALARLTLQRGGRCHLAVSGQQVDHHTDGAYAVLHLAGHCPAAQTELSVDYRLLFDVDALHRGLLRLELDGTGHTGVLAPERAEQRFSPQALAQSTRWASFGAYLVEGVWHIGLGFDHALFLLALLLPAVLVREGRVWRSAASLPAAARQVLWVVTAFTLAHSLTLTLAVLGYVALPTRWVESLIAASVLLAAANNLWPLVRGRRRVAAFGFGLIHGFGFASVLAELGLPPDALIVSLLGFNLGVELGQLAIVALFLPVAYRLRATAFYRRVVLLGGSGLAMAVALVWLAERALNLKLISA